VLSPEGSSSGASTTISSLLLPAPWKFGILVKIFIAIKDGGDCELLSQSCRRRRYEPPLRWKPSRHLQIIKHRHQQHSTARNQCSITMPQGLEHWPLETSFPSCQSFRRVLTASQNQDLPRPKLKLEHPRGWLWRSSMHSSVPSMYYVSPSLLPCFISSYRRS
jgi:hypothetical protein